MFRTSYGPVVELAGSVLDWEENPFTKNLQIDPSIFNDHLCWVYIETSQWGQKKLRGHISWSPLILQPIFLSIIMMSAIPIRIQTEKADGVYG